MPVSLDTTLRIVTWTEGVKLGRKANILSVFMLCALISKHTLIHLRNGNTWTTMLQADLSTYIEHVIQVFLYLFQETTRNIPWSFLEGPWIHHLYLVFCGFGASHLAIFQSKDVMVPS